MASTSKKIYIAISSAVILCLISILLISNNGQKQLSSKSPTPSVQSSAPSTESQTLISTSASSVQKPTEERIAISLKAGDDTYQISIPKDSSVYNAMMFFSASSVKPFTFKAENYPSLGYFVKSINGVKNSGGYYWTLYVNGKYSTVGASQYKLSNGDQIEWKYE